MESYSSYESEENEVGLRKRKKRIAKDTGLDQDAFDLLLYNQAKSNNKSNEDDELGVRFIQRHDERNK